MARKFKDRQELWDKIDWEGGVLEAVEYGITVDWLPDGDSEIREAWQVLVDVYKSLRPALNKVNSLLEEYEVD